MKIAIIINSQRFTPELNEKLHSTELSEKYGIKFDLFTPEPTELENTLKQLNTASYNAVLIGGGDGTIRTALQILIDKDVPVFVLPLGTFNVLAKTLNLPNDIDKAFEIIKNNKMVQIDLAEVNGHIIVNHAWLGFYYYILKEREKHKHTLGRSRFLKAVFNTVFLLKEMPLFVFDVVVNNKKICYKTCLLFISNNETATNLANFAEKKTLARGDIAVTIIHAHTRWQLFLCMLDVLLHGLKKSKYTVTFSVKALTVDANTPDMRIVIDGELFTLRGPLKFLIHPKKLTMLVP